MRHVAIGPRSMLVAVYRLFGANVLLCRYFFLLLTLNTEGTILTCFAYSGCPCPRFRSRRRTKRTQADTTEEGQGQEGSGRRGYLRVNVYLRLHFHLLPCHTQHHTYVYALICRPMYT